MEDLPEDAVFVIFLQLPIPDIGRMASVCKKFQAVSEKDMLWKMKSWELNSEAQKDDFPDIDTWKEIYRSLLCWEWDPDSAPPGLSYSDRNRVVQRTPLFSGTNPALRTTKKFLKSRAWYEVLVEDFADWFGIGLSTPDFTKEGAGVLGGQSTQFNAAYFTQGNTYMQKGSGKIKSEKYPYENVEPLQKGDRIGVLLDVDENTVHFFRNRRAVAHLLAVPDLKELEIYPAIGIGPQSQIRLLNSRSPQIPVVQWDD